MCGIAAVFGLRRIECEGAVGRILQRISHRGVAFCGGEYMGGEFWGMGANRLPIESLAARRQPRKSANGQIVLAYNGEVYNWRRLSVLRGSFNEVGTLDETQAVVELIARSGARGLAELDGMFALCWIDLSSNDVFFARDRMGIKPLYYSLDNSSLMLSSEIKGLAAEDEVDSICWVEPGTVCRVQFRIGHESPTLETFSFSSITDCEEGEEPSPEELLGALDEAVYRCIDTRQRVGVLLSGGVDSSAVLGLALRHRHDIVAVCGGRAAAEDVRAAVGISGALGVEVLVGNVPSEEALFSTVVDVIRVVESYEPNLVRQGSASLFLAKMARDHGLDVLLCGEGADELFCGYPEFVGLDPEGIRELRYSFLRDLHRTQLQRVDRTSMAYTVEVRVPYLMRSVLDCALRTRDPEKLVRFEGGEPITKILLRDSLKGIIPDDWRMRPKMVLSEGMGLGGNDPEKGMFSTMVKAAISGEEVSGIRREFSDWGVASAEEAFYFREFHRLGYTKLSAARERVCANKVNSLRPVKSY